MTQEDLERKAEEYANETQFTEYDNPSLSESLDISEEIKQAYIAGAKEIQAETLKEIIEIEKVSDFRWKENEQLKAQIKILEAKNGI